MQTLDNKKPLIRQGWLRALLFAGFYTALLLAATQLLPMILGPADGPAAENRQFFIRFLVTAALSLLAVGLFRLIIDRKSIMSMGLSFSNHGAHAGAGFFIGVLMVCGGTLVLGWTDHLEWTGTEFNGNDLFISLGLMVIVAVYEELVFRGYLLNNLLDGMNKWAALAISAAFFTLAHAGNPGFSFLPGLNIFIAGLLLGINYIYTRNCWFGILLHFSWNFFQGPILGYDVSGIHLQSLFQHDIKGDELLTGGTFGLEGSIIAAVLYLLALGTLVLVYERKFYPKTAA